MKKAIYCQYVIFCRLSTPRKDGKVLIQIRVYSASESRYKHISTGIYIYPKYWDSKNKCIRNSHSRAIQLNKRVAKFKSELQDFEISIVDKGRPFFLDMFDDIDSNFEWVYFNDFYSYQMSLERIATGTLAAHKSTLKKLNSFDSKILFSNLTLDFIQRFEKYLEIQGLATNSIATRMKHVKKYVRHALKKGLIPYDEYPFKDHKIKSRKTRKTRLESHEVEALEQLDLDYSQELREVRNLFLFSLYSGLRYCDVVNVQKHHIVNSNGSLFLDLRQIKTQDFVMIPIGKLFHGKAIEIIRSVSSSTSERLFRPLSNQHVNRMLKVVGQMAGIKKVLTHKVARISFATLLYEEGVRVNTIQKLMGHNSLEQTEEYIQFSPQNVAKEIEDIFI